MRIGPILRATNESERRWIHVRVVGRKAKATAAGLKSPPRWAAPGYVKSKQGSAVLNQRFANLAIGRARA